MFVYRQGGGRRREEEGGGGRGEYVCVETGRRERCGVNKTPLPTLKLIINKPFK